MPRKRITQLNSVNYDMLVPDDMSTLEFNQKIHPVEFDIIWFLLYNAKRDFMKRFSKDVKLWKQLSKPKDNILETLNDFNYYFDMQELKTFCNNDTMVKRKLKNVTSIVANTNTFGMNDLPLTKQESDSRKLDLITGMNGKQQTYTIDSETMYKILLLPPTHFNTVSLICTADLPSVKSKTMYHILCAYEGIHMVKSKTLQQWVATINLSQTRNNLDYNKFINTHLSEMINDMSTSTNFLVNSAIKKDLNNKITITYKGRH